MPDRRRSSGHSEDGSQGRHQQTTEAAGFNAHDSTGRHGYQSYRTSLAQVKQTVYDPSMCLVAQCPQNQAVHTDIPREHAQIAQPGTERSSVPHQRTVSRAAANSSENL